MRTPICAVYILTNKHHTVLYTGVTSDLVSRLHEHRTKQDRSSFAARYNADKLVFFDTTPNILAAIAREKQIKGWTRARKVALIEALNPDWTDLSADWTP